MVERRQVGTRGGGQGDSRVAQRLKSEPGGNRVRGELNFPDGDQVQQTPEHACVAQWRFLAGWTSSAGAGLPPVKLPPSCVLSPPAKNLSSSTLSEGFLCPREKSHSTRDRSGGMGSRRDPGGVESGQCCAEPVP